jgi:hypothetical protein
MMNTDDYGMDACDIVAAALADAIVKFGNKFFE